jgi:hypothetical protein
MNRASLGGRLAESFRGEIFEYPDGRFDLRAEFIDWQGKLERIS